MRGKWSKREPIDPDEAQRLADKFVTDEARAELDKSPISVAEMVRLSLRAGVVLCDGEPCAIVGVRQSGLMQLLWFLPLVGLRGKVRGFVRYMQSLEHYGPVWAEASDAKARLVRIGGAKPDGKFWRLR